MKRQKYPLQRPAKLPGTLWDNNGTWYWRGVLPGTEARRAYAIKMPSGQTLPASVPREAAEAEAWKMWDAAARAGHRPAESGRRHHLKRLVADYMVELNQLYRSPITGRPSAHAIVAKGVVARLLDRHANQPADAITSVELSKIVDGWIAEGLKRETINKYLSIVKKFYTWLLQRGQVSEYTESAIGRFPRLERFRSRAAESTPVMPVRAEAVKAVLPLLTPTLRDMVLVQYICSMRPGEVCRMTPAEIDRSDPEVWTYEPTHHKTKHKGKLRIIGILRAAREILEPRIADRGEHEPIFSAADSYREHLARKHADRKTPLNAGNAPAENPMIRAGNQYDPAAYARRIRETSRRVAAEKWVEERHQPVPSKPEPGERDSTKIEPWKAWEAHRRQWEFTVYQLRHAGGTKARAKAGAAVAAILLGHAKGSAATEIYTHTVARDEKREEARAAVREAAKLLESDDE